MNHMVFSFKNSCPTRSRLPAEPLRCPFKGRACGLGEGAEEGARDARADAERDARLAVVPEGVRGVRDAAAGGQQRLRRRLAQRHEAGAHADPDAHGPRQALDGTV